MPALKEILADRIGTSMFANSPMWEQQVDKIHPSQLQAFITRHSYKGDRDKAESAVQIALAVVAEHAMREKTNFPPMMSYYRPDHVVITMNEMKNGLAQLGDLKAAMVLFALEMDLDATAVSQLTHRALQTLVAKKPLSDLAKECLRFAPPRHLTLQYVFWEDGEAGMPMPVFGLDGDVFDAWGMVWGELTFAYTNISYSIH